MGLAKSILRWRQYSEDPNLVLTNFETKDLHVSRCLVRRGFHLHLAIRSAHLSFLAYRSPGELAEYMRKFPACSEHYHIQSTFHDPKTDIHGMIVLDRRDHSLYIVFRGTSTEKDVMTDLGFIPVTYENMEGVKVHSGIYNSLMTVKDYLIDYVKGWQQQFFASSRPDVPVVGPLAASGKLFIVGHSLGGCLSSLLAPILYRECGIYSQVYTIGACPVGNDAFMALLKDCTYNHWNVVNHLDIVPVLTRPLQCGYSQFPQIAYYDGRGDLVYLSGRKFNQQMLNRLVQRILGWHEGNQILNHLMYLGLTSRTAMETPLDQYVYAPAAQRTWLDEEDTATGDDGTITRDATRCDHNTDDTSLSSSCSDDDEHDDNDHEMNVGTVSCRCDRRARHSPIRSGRHHVNDGARTQHTLVSSSQCSSPKPLCNSNTRDGESESSVSASVSDSDGITITTIYIGDDDDSSRGSESASDVDA